MGLLKSIDNVPGIDFYDYRDNQYYNKYEYRMRANVPCIRYTWYCKSPEDLEKKIRGEKVGWSTIRKEDKAKVIEHAEALKTIISIQCSRAKTKDLGLRIEGSTISFFSNDLQSLKQIETLFGTEYKFDFTQVQTAQYAGVKHFVNEPKHKYRIYLKSRIVSEPVLKEFKSTLDRTKSLCPSPALLRWIDRNKKTTYYHRWSSASHFIDYDDESTLSYLALLHGDMLGKKYKLEKRP